jgi:hypothetical protein
LHHTKFKAPEKLYAEKRSIQPFPAMQPRLPLAGAKLRRGGAREKWREPARTGENMTGEIWLHAADTPPIYTAPRASPPKGASPFPPFGAIRP